MEIRLSPETSMSNARYAVRPNPADHSYDVIDQATGAPCAFHPLTPAGYMRAYQDCNRLNYAEAEQLAIDLADERAARETEALAEIERLAGEIGSHGYAAEDALLALDYTVKRAHIEQRCQAPVIVPNPDDELTRREDELAQRCPCFAFGEEQPACLASGKCEGWAPYPQPAPGPAARWRANQERIREIARDLGLLAPPAEPDPEPPAAVAAVRTYDDFRTYAFQLGHLLGDPLIGLWVDQDRIDAWAAGELARMDPASAQIAEAEARWLRLVHSTYQRAA